jgi:hypothetical protein
MSATVPGLETVLSVALKWIVGTAMAVPIRAASTFKNFMMRLKELEQHTN